MVRFDYESIPLRNRYMYVPFDPNRTNPYLALINLVGNLGETLEDTIKEKVGGFETAKGYQIDIYTYDSRRHSIKAGSYHKIYEK